MRKNKVKLAADKILKDWVGPSGKYWGDELKREVDPEEAKLCGSDCEAIDELNDHPPKYIRPKDITW